MLTFLLASCLNELPIAAGPGTRPPLGDQDADTDIDADTDTDNPLHEDCDNGTDDDGDGFVDCEDSDCFEDCVDDCDDGVDNHGDGDVDCSDDECVGDEACGVTWTITAETFTEKAYIAYGQDLEDWHGYPALLWMRGDVEVDALSSEGDSFHCAGEFDVGPPAWEDAGTWWEDGTCEGCDFRWVMAPKVEEGTLHWRTNCPLDQLHPVRVGSHRGQDELTAILEGDWQPQYVADEAGWGWDSSDGYDFKWAGFWYLYQNQPRTWTVNLD